MLDFGTHLRWLDSQHETMCRLVSGWSRINSHSHNVSGLQACADTIERECSSLRVPIERLDLTAPDRLDDTGHPIAQSLGQALRLSKRGGTGFQPVDRTHHGLEGHATSANPPLRILLAIHYDTVYPPDNPFQTPTRLDDKTLRGPGVADAKGGLVVLLKALQAFEQSPFASTLGWEILLNPDEEIGSPGSAPLFLQAARRNDLALLFEPTFPDGALVSERKGSGIFSLLVTGRSAHVGRDPASGRNAIHALARFITAVESLNDPDHGIVVNVGHISGGGPVNVVPERAFCRFNIRVTKPQQQHQVEERLRRLTADINSRDGLSATLHGSFHAPPKPLDAQTSHLLHAIADTGQMLGLNLAWRPTGGVSDGNRLAAAGLPTLDTLGPRGGNLHSPDEYVVLDSLVERAKLVALFLMRLASGGIPWSHERTPSK